MKSKKMTIEIFRLLETNQATFRRPKIVNRESTMANLFSPRQLEGELELAGIESCRRFLTAVPKRIHVGHIETVDDVESVHYAFESEPVAEGDALGNPNVREVVFGLDSSIRPEIAR